MSIKNNLKKIYKHIDEKYRFKTLIFFNFINGFLEILGIAIIIPFVNVLSNPNKIRNSSIYRYSNLYFPELQLNNNNNLVYFISLLFFLVIIISGIIKLILMKYNHTAMYELSSKLSLKIFANILTRPFEKFTDFHSANIINTLTTKIITLTSVLNSIILIIASSIFTVLLSLTLILYKPYIVISFSFFLFILYFTINKITKKILTKNSENLTRHESKIINLIQVSFGTIKDVIISNKYNYYINDFKINSIEINKLQSKNYFIGHSPKIIIESFALIFIGFSAIYLNSKNGNLISVLPMMTVFIISAQRLLPAIQNIYQNISNIKSAEHTLGEIVYYLELPIFEIQDRKENFHFNQKIIFQNIYFKYSKTNTFILNNINFEICKNDMIAFVGKTGSGKTTCADLLMGLLYPTSGKILLDNIELVEENIKFWQKNISFVPQEIFLKEGSITENIVLGQDISNINYYFLNTIIEKAGLKEFITQPGIGLDYNVGERGSRLSGGQKQRIGIARALYQGSKILIFDEATSALDNDTEKKIIETLNHLSKEITLIIIAHRHSTIVNCNKIFEFKNNKINLYNSYYDYNKNINLDNN